MDIEQFSATEYLKMTADHTPEGSEEFKRLCEKLKSAPKVRQQLAFEFLEKALQSDAERAGSKRRGKRERELNAMERAAKFLELSRN